ncbi:MAG: prepilin peptidase [Deltaproteobacteria bacterium]|nr:prepilin peptidase [Deltaproteobacteria bacterium]MBW2265120.1 prepilin peptidase [Deltaproteobacteria bacterium]MBW2601179.1 prepilin peptidase [Deltaproteobacteria bacterium]
MENEIQSLIIKLFVFFFGMAIGSFLNVCIYRLPESISLVHPGSRCPKCKTKIAFYDNIPVLSYIILRGKCRHCETTISLRYLVVEMVSGLFALAIVGQYGFSLETIFVYAFVAALLVVTFIDIDHQIIPDVITYPGIIIGFLSSFLLDHHTYMESIMGIILGGGFLFLVASGYYYLTKKEGMGGGDVKLLAMIGAFLGWKATIFTIFVGSIIGTVLGIVVALYTQKGRKTAVPFGPFLSMGAFLYIFHGQQIMNWYFRLVN